MREFDDNPHSYGPVLRRIGILVAVIVMVPVMLWTITSFMRTYVAQPVIASPKPLFAPATTASIDTANAGTPAASSSDSAPTQTASITATGTTANDSNAQSPTAKVASLATSDMPPSITPAATPQPAANSPSTNSPSTNSPWPDPNQAIGGQAASAQMPAPDNAAATATNDDALPPAPPLTGRSHCRRAGRQSSPWRRLELELDPCRCQEPGRLTPARRLRAPPTAAAISSPTCSDKRTNRYPAITLSNRASAQQPARVLFERRLDERLTGRASGGKPCQLVAG